MAAIITKADVPIPNIIKFTLGSKTYYTDGYFGIINDDIIINEELNDFFWKALRIRHYSPFFKNLSQIDLSKFKIDYPKKYYLFLDEVDVQIEEYDRTDFELLEIIIKGNSPYMSILTDLKIQDLEWLNDKPFYHVKYINYGESCFIQFVTSQIDNNEINVLIEEIELNQSSIEDKKIQELKLQETIVFIFCDY